MSTYERMMIEKAIYATVAFFDLFDYPLTDADLWKFYLPRGGGTVPTLYDIRVVLSSSAALAELLEQNAGMIFLKGRSVLCDIRRDRMIASYKKYRRCRRMVAFLAHIPFVRMICICNTLGLNASREEADIDFFIVARSGYLWFVRLLCTGSAALLNMRPTKKRICDTLCLSFYASDTALDFSSLQLAEWNPDLYLAYWTIWCVPIYDEDKTYDAFLSANAWVRNSIPHAIPYGPIPRRRVSLSRAERVLKKLCEHMIRASGGIVEKGARALQRSIMPSLLRDKMNVGTSVVVNDSVLKFHVDDRRGEIKQRFLKYVETAEKFFRKEEDFI